MKKMMTIGLVAGFAAGFAGAQEDVVMVGQPTGNAAETTVTAEAALMSSYVWRGQVINNDTVIQPQLTVAQGDFSFNVWGNNDLVEGKDGTTGEFSEIDFSLAYSFPREINQMTFDVGLISYNFPNVMENDAAKESTTEIFAAVTFQSFKEWFIPSVTLFGDIDEVRGTYVLFDVVAPYQVSEYFAVEAGLSAGYGNTSYNTSYWADEADAGFNDYNVYLNAAYEIADNVTISANMTYTALEGGNIRDSAEAKGYEAKDKFWGGVSVAYDF